MTASAAMARITLWFPSKRGCRDNRSIKARCQIRTLTRRKIPLRMGELIETINPIIRGWGNYYCRSHVRKRFHQLDGWIIRRLWSHRAKRWRNAMWKDYPVKRLRSEFKLVSLVSLIPSLQTAQGLS